MEPSGGETFSSTWYEDHTSHFSVRSLWYKKEFADNKVFISYYQVTMQNTEQSHWFVHSLALFFILWSQKCKVRVLNTSRKVIERNDSARIDDISYTTVE